MTWCTRCLVVLVWTLLGAGTLRAADEVILGSKILIKDPTTVEDKRQVKGAGKESATSLPAVLAQPGAAATLTVVTAGTTPGTQTFALTGTWAAAGSTGWKYKAGGTSPVKSILLKRTASGKAQLKVLIKGNVGTDPLTLVPPNTGTEAGVVLDDGNGTRYCVRLGGPAGGVVKKNDPTQFQLAVSKVTPAIEAGCPTTTTTSTTLPSTSTSSSSTSTSTSTTESTSTSTSSSTTSSSTSSTSTSSTSTSSTSTSTSSTTTSSSTSTSTTIASCTPEGSACDDGNACTQADTCQAGACVGTPVVCAASDQCHMGGTCDPASGVCFYSQKADGSACDDGSACTQTDTCQAGACVGSAPNACAGAGSCLQVTGNNGNDILFFQSAVATVCGELTNPYSGRTIPIDDVYNVNTACYDGHGGNDTLLCTNAGDLFCLDQGVQTLFSVEAIVAGNGPDIINLASTTFVGNAVNINGGVGVDVLWGNAGNDVISGIDGNDMIDGGPGNDTVNGGNNDDVVSGGDGNDTVTGDAGNDTVDGGAGNDVVSGGNENDRLIYAMTENAGATDGYDGGTGTDTLQLNLTAAQATQAAAEIAAAQAFIVANSNPAGSTGPGFTFSSFGLTFSNIEVLEVYIVPGPG